jgi:hypothetical protein
MMLWYTIREVGFVVIVSEVVYSVHSKMIIEYLRFDHQNTLLYTIIHYYAQTVQLGPPIAIQPGYQTPRQPSFAQNMHPIKRCRRSLARPNRTTPEYPDVNNDVAVGRQRRFCFISPVAFVGGMGR